MNKIRLFKINCVIASFFVLSLMGLIQKSYAGTSISNNGITVEQTLKEQIVTINIKNQPVKEILYEIQKQSGVSFAVNENESGGELSKMSLQVKNLSVDKALDQLFANTNFTYKVVGNSVTIVKRPETQKPVTKFTLMGKVIDGSTKRPVVGATVLVVGTATGAITDDKGTYSVSISVGQTLEVSYMGMKPFLKKIETELKELNVTLELDQMNIENVVVTGYGNVNKQSFTGNTTTVKGEDLMKVNRTNVVKALQAFDPSFRLGDDIKFGSDPNALPDVYIRGRSSMGTMGLDKDKLSKNSLESNPNTPTFIVDGFEVSLQTVYDMDPNRIQTLTMLKDAAATAMYGSRAANGVIVITTIPPKEGKLRVSYNVTATFELPNLRDYNLMNAKEKLEAERLSGVYDPTEGGDAFGNETTYYKIYNEIYIEGVETDWKSLPLRSVVKHQHSATVEGGTSTIRYSFNGNYANDNGVMKGSRNNTGGMGLKLSMNVGKLNIDNNVEFSMRTGIDSPYGSFSDFTHQQPYVKYKDEKDNYLTSLKRSGTNNVNPMYEASLNNFSENRMNMIINNLQLRWNFTENLYLEGKLGVSQQWNDDNRFVDPKSFNSSVLLSADNMLAGDLYTGIGKSGKINGRFLLSYNKVINKHIMTFSLNAEMTENTGDNVSTHYRGFPSGSLSSLNYAVEVYGKPLKTENKSRTAGLSAVLNYSFNNIYSLDLNGRYEGSSMFGSKQKTAPYWAAGVRVNIHNYEFMRNVTAIDNLVIRGSYGQTGNVSFPAYTAQNYYEAMFDDWYITGYGTKIKYLGNPDLKGETTNTLDVGFNFTFLKGRLDLDASYFNKTTMDMINDVTIPTSSGFSVYKDNLGKVRNTGFEVAIRGVVLQKKDLNISVYGNFASQENKIVEVAQSLKDYNEKVNKYYESDPFVDVKNESDKKVIWTKYEEGRSMTALYGMKSLGIDPATGQEVFLNRAGGVVHEWDAREMVDIGDTEPFAVGSFGLNGRYKNFTLTATFRYEFGGYYYNQTLIDQVENAPIETRNVDKRVLTDRWQKPGDVTPLKDIKDRRNDTRPTSRFMQKNNLLSLQSISLQYEFGESITKKLHVERLRVEASCSDLFRACTIKQERGLDYPFANSYGLSLMVNF